MKRDTLSKLIDKSQAHDSRELRDYIGASTIGSDCLRQIWYEFVGTIAEDVPTKTRRTWEIGKRLEGLVLDWLDKAGVETVRRWHDLRSKNVKIFKGHVDSIWIKDSTLQAIIEIKTAKDASFKIFVNKGLALWNPQYYAQVQAYMGMSGIHSTYILVLNKDNSDLSDELVTFDADFYKGLEDKALMVSRAVMAPPRINGSPLYFKCKMCKFNKVCHQ